MGSEGALVKLKFEECCSKARCSKSKEIVTKN